MRNAFKCISISTILTILDEPNVVLVIEDGDRSFRYQRDDMQDSIPYERELENVNFHSYFISLNGVKYLKCVINQGA